MKDFLELELNKSGIDYICPDIHGDFPSLMDALRDIGFNFEKDRLFCLGDLINRGLYSEQVINYIGESWFYSVKGNHEKLFTDAYEDLQGSKVELSGQENNMESLKNLVANGGYWAVPIMMKKRVFKKYYDALNNLPLMMQITNGERSVALAHAEIPYGMTFKKAKKILLDADHKKHGDLRSDLIGGRKVYNKFNDSKNPSEEKFCIPDIVALFSGHTFVKQNAPLQMANRFYLENKAWDFGRGHDYNILNLNKFFSS